MPNIEFMRETFENTVLTQRNALCLAKWQETKSFCSTCGKGCKNSTSQIKNTVRITY